MGMWKADGGGISHFSTTVNRVLSIKIGVFRSGLT
jgi:hypothetical protein